MASITKYFLYDLCINYNIWGLRKKIDFYENERKKIGNEDYKENLKKIKEFVKENFDKGDIILIQGNWGYTYNLVKWSIEKELIPVYSYTERNVEEIKEGETVKKISYFKHVKFIKYE